MALPELLSRATAHTTRNTINQVEFEYLAARYPCSCLDLSEKQPLESCNYKCSI